MRVLLDILKYINFKKHFTYSQNLQNFMKLHLTFLRADYISHNSSQTDAQMLFMIAVR